MTPFLFGTSSLRQHSIPIAYVLTKITIFVFCVHKSDPSFRSNTFQYDSNSFIIIIIIIIVAIYPFRLLIWFVVSVAPAQMTTWNYIKLSLLWMKYFGQTYWKHANWSFIFHFSTLHGYMLYSLLYLDL